MLKLTYWTAALIALIAAFKLAGDEHKPTPIDYSKTPVLFVHGHGLTPNDWDPLMNYLSRQGYPSEYLFAVEIRPSVMANVPAAETFVAPAVEALLERASIAAERQGKGRRFEQVDLVGHSMGAVSSRWYAARLRPERVRTWIGIAGANHGTNVLCEYSDAGAADMCPAFAGSVAESSVQAMLNGVPGDATDESPFGVGQDAADSERVPPDAGRSIHYYTIRIEPDDWIVPADSAVLDGAGGTPIDLPPGFDIRETSAGNFRSFRRLDHMSILDDDQVHRLTLMLLATTPID